jgi:hypothetical protein
MSGAQSHSHAAPRAITSAMNSPTPAAAGTATARSAGQHALMGESGFTAPT